MSSTTSPPPPPSASSSSSQMLLPRTPQQQQQNGPALHPGQVSPRPTGSPSPGNNTPQQHATARRARAMMEKTRLVESSPIIVAPDDSVLEAEEDNAPLVIDTPTSGPVPVAPPRPKQTVPPITTKSAVAELMRLETQKKQTKEELEQIDKLIKCCEGKLILHMQKNDLMRIAAGDTAYLELRMKQKREKPRAKTVLERLTQILASGERDAVTIFKYIRAPISVKTDVTLSRRQRRKAGAKKKGSKGIGPAAVTTGARKEKSDVPPK